MPRRRVAELPQHEEEILREHHRTLFGYDIGIKSAFHGDFEAYFQAILDPRLMERRLRARMKELEKIIRRRRSPERFDVGIIDDPAACETGTSWSRRFEDETMPDDDEWQRVSRHPLVAAARSLSDSVRGVLDPIYEARGRRREDADLYRASVNLLVLSVKVYSLVSMRRGRVPDDRAFERRYARVILTFLRRALDSLQRLTLRAEEHSLIFSLLISHGRSLEKGIRIFLNDRTAL